MIRYKIKIISSGGTYKSIKKLGFNLVEMPRSKKTSFCCGAGGAQMFKEPEKGKQDININRTKEALETNAELIATGCPFCNTMMTDGVKFLAEGSVEVLDIAEIIVEINIEYFLLDIKNALEVTPNLESK